MLTAKNFKYKRINFPCGEMHIRVEEVNAEPLSILFEFDKNEDIIELLLVCDALKRMGQSLAELTMPYIPFARQDRVGVEGECFSLRVFADVLNGLRLKRIVVTDPHSDVATALIDNCVVIKQADIFVETLTNKADYWLISPDAGALKKTYALAAKVKTLGVVECGKHRNMVDGQITGVIVHAEDLKGKDCYIVDDICDGGRTFIEIAKCLKLKNCGKIVLLVTHGFFTKGLNVFDGLIDEIYTRKGKIK